MTRRQAKARLHRTPSSSVSECQAGLGLDASSLLQSAPHPSGSSSTCMLHHTRMRVENNTCLYTGHQLQERRSPNFSATPGYQLPGKHSKGFKAQTMIFQKLRHVPVWRLAQWSAGCRCDAVILGPRGRPAHHLLLLHLATWPTLYTDCQAADKRKRVRHRHGAHGKSSLGRGRGKRHG